MLKSKKLTENLNFSRANFKLGWKLLRRFRNPSSLWLWLFKLMYMIKKTHDLFNNTSISVLLRSFINVKSNYKKNADNSATL